VVVTVAGLPLALLVKSLTLAWLLTPAVAWSIDHMGTNPRLVLLVGVMVNILVWWSVLVVAIELVAAKRRRPVA
jgi:hypothetical protein